MGGLGIRNMNAMKDSLWARTLASKYIRGEANHSKLPRKNCFSKAWRGITTAAGSSESSGRAFEPRFVRGETHSFGEMFG